MRKCLHCEIEFEFKKGDAHPNTKASYKQVLKVFESIPENPNDLPRARKRRRIEKAAEILGLSRTTVERRLRIGSDKGSGGTANRIYCSDKCRSAYNKANGKLAKARSKLSEGWKITREGKKVKRQKLTCEICGHEYFRGDGNRCKSKECSAEKHRRKANKFAKKKKIEKLKEQGYQINKEGYITNLVCQHTNCGKTFSSKNNTDPKIYKHYDKRYRDGRSEKFHRNAPLMIHKYCSGECEYQHWRMVETRQRRINRGAKPRKIECPICGEKSETYIHNKITCGRKACSKEYQSRLGKEQRDSWRKEERKCTGCEKTFQTEVWKRTKYCSIKCYNKYKARITHEQVVNLDDKYVVQLIKSDFKSNEDIKISEEQISPQMIEDKKLLLRLGRAWEKATGKRAVYQINVDNGLKVGLMNRVSY